MRVSDVMSRNIISVSPDDHVSKFISVIEKYKIHEVPVISNGNLLGMLYVKNVAKKNILDPNKIKVSTVMDVMSPSVSSNADVKESAELLIKSGLRALPVVDSGKIIGIFSVHDIIETAKDDRRFKQNLVENLMSVPEIVEVDDSIEKARTLMKEKNISHVPVINDGSLVGLITEFDVVKSLKPHERIGWHSMSADMEKVSGISVSTIMNHDPITVSRDVTAAEAAKLLCKNKISSLVVTEGRVPVGILTLKDLLEFYVSDISKKGIYYQVTGLSNEDDFSVNTMHRMIGDTLRKLSKIYDLQYFYVHMKRHEEGKKSRTKYTIRTRLMTGAGMFQSHAWAWSLMEATDEALSNLEKIIIKHKSEDVTKTRKNSLRRKEYI